MRLNLKLPQRAEADPEMAAKILYRGISKIDLLMESKTYSSKGQREIRERIRPLLSDYDRCFGNNCYYTPLMQRSERVAWKVSEIADLNFEDWNNYRRGQKFRRLREALAELGHELSILEPSCR